jgi:glutaredoxin
LLVDFAQLLPRTTLLAEKRGKETLALVIYTKPGCPYCEQARDYYNSKGIPFIDYDAQNDRARRAEMFKYSGDDPTVPCIVENGKYLGSGWGNPPRG